MRRSILLMVGILAGSICRGEDFRNGPFTVSDLRAWIANDLPIEDLKSAFGENPMVLGSLELIEEHENQDEEIFAGTERYVYAVEQVGVGEFQRAEKWTMGCPTISFRFSGAAFIEAYILNPDAQHLIRIYPDNSKANK